MSLTLEQITVLALARAGEVADIGPVPRSVAYRRIGIDQQLILEDAGRSNPEFYGAAATANLTAGVADFADVVPPVPTPALIQIIVIANPGTSGLLAGTVINVVPFDDVESAIPPRATLRDLVLRQVGTELALITSVTMAYSRRSPMYLPTDGGTVVELASPYDELLVIRLAKWLVAKHPKASSPDAVQLITAMTSEENALTALFTGYVKSYAPMGSRFGIGI